MDYTLTPVLGPEPFDTDGANVETLVPWLDPFPDSSGGYYAVVGGACRLASSQDGNRGLCDLTGSYTNAQYVSGTVGALAAGGSAAHWLAAYLHAQGAPAHPPSTQSAYRLKISQYSVEVPLTTKIQKLTNGTTVDDLATTTSITWADGDKFLFLESPTGDLEVYQDTGSGWSASPVLTYTDGSPLTGGVPGLHINRPTSYTIDDVEMGDVAAAGGDTTAPTLDTPLFTATGPTIGDCTVNTDEANGTLYCVVSESATPPSVAQIQAGNDSTGSPAAFADSATVTGTGAQSFSVTGLTAATQYYAHFQQQDAATNDSTVATDATGDTTDAPATLYGFDFDTAAGLIFGDLAGLAADSLAVLAAVDLTVRVYDPADGSLVVDLGTLATDSGGRLARTTDAAIVNATAYNVMFIRQSDGHCQSRTITST